MAGNPDSRSSEKLEKQTRESLQSLRIEPERKLPRRRRAVSLFLIVVGLLLGFGLSFVLNPPQASDSSKETAATTGSNASDQGMAESSMAAAQSEEKGPVILSASGYVTPRHRIALSPQVMGQTVWVGIEKGDVVKKDDVLVRLDDREYKALVDQSEASLAASKARLAALEAGSRPEEIDEARASLADVKSQLDQAGRDLDRKRVLVEQDQVEAEKQLEDAQALFESLTARLASARARVALAEKGPRQEDIDAARAQVAAAEASLEYAKLQVEDTVIRAPSDGTILEKLVEVGELVSPQSFGGSRGARTELLSLADLSDLQVEVDISESDFQKIRMGRRAKVYLDAYPDIAYDGKVREIAPEANREKATIQVKVAILSPDKLVRPEMSARVDFLREEGEDTMNADGEK